MRLPMNQAQAVRELRAAGMEGSNQDLIDYWEAACDDYGDQLRDDAHFEKIERDYEVEA